jgi:hypothetical protein
MRPKLRIIRQSQSEISDQQSKLPIAEPSERFYEIWKTLTDIQRRYVLARTTHANKREAALALGLRPDTVYHWPPEIEEALALLLADVLQAAWSELREAAARAARIKTEGLTLEDDRLRQQAATEILDRVLGRPRPHAPDIEDDQISEIVVRHVDYQDLK